MVKRDKVTFAELVETAQWQKIQDNFSFATQINLRTIGPTGDQITSPSLTPRLCSQAAKELTHTDRSCLPTFLGGEGIVDKNLVYNCSGGLSNFVTPLRLADGRILGYLVLGPVVLVMRKPKQEYFKIAESLNLDPEQFWDALLEIKTISYHGMQSLVELCADIAECVANFNGQGINAADTNRIFELLLDVALEVSQADAGSVMFLDDENKRLRIGLSRGIPEEIVKNSEITVGEGLAGIAAKEGASFLLNKDTAERLQPYMNRPQIDSSLVVPLRKNNKVVGVINLSAMKATGVKFNLKNLDSINRLVNLAGIAIK